MIENEVATLVHVLCTLISTNVSVCIYNSMSVYAVWMTNMTTIHIMFIFLLRSLEGLQQLDGVLMEKTRGVAEAEQHGI